VRFFAGEDRDAVIDFNLVVYELVFGPFCFAGAEPEPNLISTILSKERINCRGDQNEYVLERINF